MKIEKISDTQVKFILNHADLAERNINIGDLAFRSEKVQGLFHEMMTQALIECGFETGSEIPLMIEAMPLSAESIVIIVTRIENEEALGSRFNLFQSPDGGKFKRRPIFDNSQTSAAPASVPASPDNALIYSFGELDDVFLACARLAPFFDGESELYKESSRYYLVLRGGSQPPSLSLDSAACEYGSKQAGASIFRSFLLEHGEALVRDNAVEALAKV